MLTLGLFTVVIIVIASHAHDPASRRPAGIRAAVFGLSQNVFWSVIRLRVQHLFQDPRARSV
jgi:hypothetical protein